MTSREHLDCTKPLNPRIEPIDIESAFGLFFRIYISRTKCGFTSARSMRPESI